MPFLLVLAEIFTRLLHLGQDIGPVKNNYRESFQAFLDLLHGYVFCQNSEAWEGNNLIWNPAPYICETLIKAPHLSQRFQQLPLILVGFVVHRLYP